MYATFSDADGFSNVRLPYSFIPLIAAIAIFFLQMVPLIGFGLLLVGAPLWSGVLINGGFLGIAIETIVRRLPVGMISFPLFWFGINGVVALNDHITITGLRAEIEAHNQRVHIPFDPNRHHLVLDHSNSIGPNHYRIPVVFSKLQSEGPDEYRADYLATRAVCNAVKDETFNNVGISSFWHRTRSNTVGGGVSVEDFCTISAPANPTLPLAVVSTETKSYELDGLPVDETITSVRMPDGSKYTVRGGTAKPYGWLPTPLMACAPTTSSENNWVCGIGLMPSKPRPLLHGKWRYGRDDDALATALGIEPRDRYFRDDFSNGVLLAQVESLRDKVVENETEKLDAAIADPTKDIGVVSFNSLENRDDVIEPRLRGVVRAIEFGVKSNSKARGNAQQMFKLLEFASAEALAPYDHRLQSLWQHDSWFVWVPKPERKLPRGGVGATIVVTAGN